jgi:putative endonuclease
MPFDSGSSPARQSCKARGLTNYLAGHAAEAAVARLYEDRGIAICARNWRGKTGEIDLIGRDGDALVFVEVKQSRTHDLAATHVSQAQAGEPKGLLTDVRIDLALVDGQGRIDVVENAFAG